MPGRFYYWCSKCKSYTTTRAARSLVRCTQCSGEVEEAIVVYANNAAFPEHISHGQKVLASFIHALGLVVEVEYKIGYRFADVFLPELNVVLEFDGPSHWSPAADNQRDKELKENGISEIIHIKDTSEETLSKIRQRLEEISEGA